MKRLLTAAAFLAATLFPAHGQEMGIAIYQAPEAGLGTCVGSDPSKTAQCAKQKCVKESGLPADHCERSLLCFPMGWAGDIFMQHKEGNHWHDYVCNQTSEKALKAAVAAKCKKEWLIECALVQAWRPDGSTYAVQ